MTAFATVPDVELLYRPLKGDEAQKCCALLGYLSDVLRQDAKMCGKDLDEMIENGTVLENVVKEVLIGAVIRVMRQNQTGEPMTQESQSGLGYSWSGTYAIPGGGIGNAFLRSDYRRLGLRRQRIGGFDPYDPRINGAPLE